MGYKYKVQIEKRKFKNAHMAKETECMERCACLSVSRHSLDRNSSELKTSTHFVTVPGHFYHFTSKQSNFCFFGLFRINFARKPKNFLWCKTFSFFSLFDRSLSFRENFFFFPNNLKIISILLCVICHFQYRNIFGYKILYWIKFYYKFLLN